MQQYQHLNAIAETAMNQLQTCVENRGDQMVPTEGVEAKPMIFNGLRDTA